ncbi:Nep1-domain-containing protein, partial [Aureobasidium melanogenum]
LVFLCVVTYRSRRQRGQPFYAIFCAKSTRRRYLYSQPPNLGHSCPSADVRGEPEHHALERWARCHLEPVLDKRHRKLLQIDQKQKTPIAGQEHAEGSEDSSSAVRRRSSFEGRESKRQRQSLQLQSLPSQQQTSITTTSPRNFLPSPVSRSSSNKNLAMADIKPEPQGTQSLPPPSLPQLVAEQHVPIPASDKDSQRLIVVLSNASLETYKASSGGRGGAKDDKYSLLNSDEHIGVMRKMNRDISDARPDITHQCLLTLLDSPLNKAGKLQIYIHTAKGVLIEVSPTVRIPRTFKRFAGLMVQLLHRLSIRSTTSQEKLLKVIKNPITDHLPPNCRKVTLSFDAPVVRVSDYIGDLAPKESICVFVGAMAKGNDNFADEFKDDSINSATPPKKSGTSFRFATVVSKMLRILPTKNNPENAAHPTVPSIVTSLRVVPASIKRSSPRFPLALYISSRPDPPTIFTCLLSTIPRRVFRPQERILFSRILYRACSSLDANSTFMGLIDISRSIIYRCPHLLFPLVILCAKPAMPVSHVGLTVSHVPSACSFFLSALQPLGYRYVGNQGDSVGFGTDDADFFLSPELPGIARSNAHVAFSATSRSAVRDFYAAALTAGGQPNGAPAFRGCNDCIFNAAVLDLDGNSIEVIYHQVDDEDKYTTVSGGSRVLTWRRGIVNVLGDEDRTTFVSARRSQSDIENISPASIAETTRRSNAPSVTRSPSIPAASTSDSEPGFQITGKAIIGTILGAAAGAAVAYAMVRSEQDSAQQEADFAEAMSRKSASSRAPSKAPSKIVPSQAQTSKAKTVLSSATTSKTAKGTRVPEQDAETVTPRPRTRVHRNYSTTDSVVASRVMEQFSDIESEVPLRSHKTRSVRAIEAAPEPQTMDSKSYHSPTYVSLAPTSRASKKPGQSEAVYLPASRVVVQNSSRSQSGQSSVAPIEKQIEYVPASGFSRRPSIVTRRAVTSPPSICNTDRQIEYIPAQAQEWPPQDLVVARRDKILTNPTKTGEETSLPTEPADTLVDLASIGNIRLHRDESPFDGSDTSTIKASQVNRSRCDSAAGVPLPGSRKTSVVSAAELPLPVSRKTSVVSAAEYALPVSRKTSIVSGADMPLPDSRRPSLVSAIDGPLPMSRATSMISAHQIALPESRAGSVIGSILGRQAPAYEGVSAAGVPLPESRKTSIVGSLLDNDPIPRIDDLETVAPDDSISCVASRHSRHKRDESHHRERSHDRESRKSSSSKKHRSRSLHGEVMLRSSHRGVVNTVLLVCLCIREAELVLRRMRRGVREVLLVLLSEDDKRDGELENQIWSRRVWGCRVRRSQIVDRAEASPSLDLDLDHF